MFGDSGGNWFFRIGDSSGDKVISAYNGNWFGDDQQGVVAVNTWYHFAWSRASATNRFFFDGQLITDSTITDASISTTNLYIGGGVSSQDLDGYMDEIRISNSARYTANFTPSTTAFTADANTLLLIHSDFDGGLGADSSGNENDFAVTNLVATDQVIDSPTQNYCTLNPLHWGIRNAAGSVPLTEGNLKFTGSDTVSTYGTWYATFQPSAGSYYFEMVPTAIGSAEKESQSINVGGKAFKANGESSAGAYGSAWTVGDVIGVAVSTAGVWYSLNGTWQNSGDPVAGSNSAGVPTYPFTILTGDGSATTNSSLSGVLNFGQDSSFAGEKTAQGNGGVGEDFYYTPPTGYKALNTDNLPDPAIALPGDHFDTALYTGNGSTQTISSLDFQPDLVWIKNRTAVTSHGLTDSVRGTGYSLRSDSSDDQEPASGTPGATDDMYAFTSSGFSVGTGGGWISVNVDTYPYVAWNWKGGGTASTNEDGSIDSSVSANPTAGFSIVNWNGTEASATIGHGLSQAPELIIVKDVDSDRSWPVNIENITGTANEYLILDTTAAQATSTAYWGGTPGASVFTVGDSANTNDDASMIAYCFHSVDGYSKVGKYVGNGNADGSFVYTGFRPAYVMIKRYDSTSGANWILLDSKRDTFNAVEDSIYANLNNAEDDTDRLDFVSNGFKLRQNGTTVNTSSGKYIYLAIAESPFKTSNAR